MCLVVYFSRSVGLIVRSKVGCCLNYDRSKYRSRNHPFTAMWRIRMLWCKDYTISLPFQGAKLNVYVLLHFFCISKWWLQLITIWVFSIHPHAAKTISFRDYVDFERILNMLGPIVLLSAWYKKCGFASVSSPAIISGL